MKRLYRAMFFFDPETLEPAPSGMSSDRTYTNWTDDFNDDEHWERFVTRYHGITDHDGLNICVEMEVEEDEI